MQVQFLVSIARAVMVSISLLSVAVAQLENLSRITRTLALIHTHMLKKSEVFFLAEHNLVNALTHSKLHSIKLNLSLVSTSQHALASLPRFCFRSFVCLLFLDVVIRFKTNVLHRVGGSWISRGKRVLVLKR